MCEWSMDGAAKPRAVEQQRQRRHRAGVWPHDAARLVSRYGIARVLGVLPEPPSKIPGADRQAWYAYGSANMADIGHSWAV